MSDPNDTNDQQLDTTDNSVQESSNNPTEYHYYDRHEYKETNETDDSYHHREESHETKIDYTRG